MSSPLRVLGFRRTQPDWANPLAQGSAVRIWRWSCIYKSTLKHVVDPTKATICRLCTRHIPINAYLHRKAKGKTKIVHAGRGTKPSKICWYGAASPKRAEAEPGTRSLDLPGKDLSPKITLYYDASIEWTMKI